jgi:phenylpropionate dioxygenase-like ring-hydroxylating dioxygenase large terminal subunit
MEAPRNSTFESTDWEILSRHWYPVAVSSDLTDRPAAARLLDVDLVLFLNAASPVSARQTRLFCPIARNFDQETSIEAVRAFNLKVFEEDRALVEAQRPEDGLSLVYTG